MKIYEDLLDDIDIESEDSVISRLNNYNPVDYFDYIYFINNAESEDYNIDFQIKYHKKFIE